VTSLATRHLTLRPLSRQASGKDQLCGSKARQLAIDEKAGGGVVETGGVVALRLKCTPAIRIEVATMTDTAMRISAGLLNPGPATRKRVPPSQRYRKRVRP
jgi:hypothetical protein